MGDTQEGIIPVQIILAVLYSSYIPGIPVFQHSSIPAFSTFPHSRHSRHSRIPDNRYRVYSGVDHSCNSQWAEFPAKPLSGKGQCPPQNNFVAQWAESPTGSTSVAGGCPLQNAGVIGKKKIARIALRRVEFPINL